MAYELDYNYLGASTLLERDGHPELALGNQPAAAHRKAQRHTLTSSQDSWSAPM